jgi:uncharacterized protein
MLQNADRNNPLLLAGENGNVALLRELLRARPDLGASNRLGGTALIPASDRGHCDMVCALLDTDVQIDDVNNTPQNVVRWRATSSDRVAQSRHLPGA